MKSYAKDSINLFKALSEDKHSTGLKKGRIPVVCVFMLLFIGFAGVGFYINSQNLITMDQVSSTQDFIIENQSKYEIKLKQQIKLQEIVTYNKACQQYIDELKAANRIDSKAFDRIDKCKPKGMYVTGYKFKENEIEITCTALSEYAPSEFAKALTHSDEFVNVSYHGFDSSYESDGVTLYNFNIVCTFKQNEEK